MKQIGWRCLISKVTVYDIADSVGVSPATVSRVLNNSVLVADQMRERILEAASELGYRKRVIRRQRARSILNIALVLPRTERSPLQLFYDPAELIGGLAAGLGEARANTLALLAGEGAPILETKKLGDLDGCVFAFSVPQPSLRTWLTERKIPWVVLNRVSDDFSYVSNDNSGGMRQLVRRVFERWGLRMRPCYFGFDPVAEVSAERERGFRSAVAGCGIDSANLLVRNADSLADITVETLTALVRNGCNALFCFNDIMAVHVYQLALRARIRVPQDVVLTGFDRSPVRELALLPIDTMSLSVFRLGQEAGGWLRSRILDRTTEELHLLIEGEYVRGETVMPPDSNRRGRQK